MKCDCQAINQFPHFPKLNSWVFRDKYHFLQKLTTIYLNHKKMVVLTPNYPWTNFVQLMEKIINNLDQKNYWTWKKIFVQNYQWRCFAYSYSQYHKEMNTLFRTILPVIEQQLLTQINIKCLFAQNHNYAS